MVSYSDEFKINQNILWIVFFELGIILSFFLGSWKKAQELSFNITKIDTSSIVFEQVFILILVNFFVVWLFASKCKVRVDHIGFSVRYRPIIMRWKTRRWEDISAVEFKKMSPFGDFGGWGLRIGRNKIHGYAFNKGVYAIFQLKKGRKVAFQIRRCKEFSSLLKTNLSGIELINSNLLDTN